MECRICYTSQNYFYNKLISPCKCKGTMAYIHQYCLYKYFPNKRCNICQTDFNTNIYIIFDVIRHLFYQICILFIQYFSLMNMISIKLFIFLFILIETIFIFKRLYSISLIFRNNLILLCLSYQSMKTILLLYILYSCHSNICYDIFSVILYIQLNLMLYLCIYRRNYEV